MEIRTVKHMVLDTGLKDTDIRPTKILGRFSELCRKDCQTYFSDTGSFVSVACPGCKSRASRSVTQKDGFTFNQCDACLSFFVSPRPNEEMLRSFRETSEAYRYKVGQFIPAGAQARRYHLVASFAQWLGRLFESYGNKEARCFMDMIPISTLVLEEVSAQHRFAKLCAYEPNPLLGRACDNVGASEINEEDPIPPDLGAVSATEMIEHLFDPERYFRFIQKILAQGGMFFFTTRTSSGFDLSILGPQAPYIYVPEHLNLLSEAGMDSLLKRTGFEVIESSTPGQLDIQFVMEAMKVCPELNIPQFASFLITQRDETTHHDFQNFLQKHKLSSHLRMAVRKASEGA